MNPLSHQSAFSISNHAYTRMAQRGVQSRILDVLLMHGSRAKVGGGCERYRLLDRTVRQLEADGYDAQLLKSATKLRAIVSADGAVVTCYRGSPEQRRRPARNPARDGRQGHYRFQTSSPRT
jgi:hypothetical protein